MTINAMRSMWCICLSVLTGLLVSCIWGAQIDKHIPRELNATKWKSVIVSISDKLQISNQLHQITFLLILHFLQVLMCFPFMHVTKILYGYWLGLLYGWILCCSWELMLIFVYIVLIQPKPNADIENVIDKLRQQGVLWFELILLAMSSIPLQIDACVVEFGNVSVWEVWTANFVVTCIMSLKNVYCGYLLSQSASLVNMTLVTCLIAFSTIVPTMATIYISSKTLYKCFKHYQSQRPDDLVHDKLLLDSDQE